MSNEDFEDQAAMHILAAMLAHPQSNQIFFISNEIPTPAGYAQRAYQFASALREQRQKLERATKRK